MLLAIDVGNTNIVFAVFDGDVQQGSWRISTDERRTGDEYAAWLLQLMALAGLPRAAVTDAILASVVPAANFNLTRMVRDHFGLELMVVGQPGVELGVRALVDNPREVGADRLVNAAAGRAFYEPPLIIIDFGTATTFDIVNADGDYCGGIIAPGINLSVEALFMAAAKLPKVEIVRPERVIGRNTITAMQSGIFWGYVGLIEGLVSRIREEYGEGMKVIGTGGLAGLFSEATDAIDMIDDDITLRGLVLIHARNRPI